MKMADQSQRLDQLPELVENWVQSYVDSCPVCPVLGMSGAQGIGKTTALSKLVKMETLRVAILSLDDFYLTKAERKRLGETVHELCVTRGVPGTHDVTLLSSTIQSLQDSDDGSTVHWPKFDKVTDDRASEPNAFNGRPDAILLEGWMIGATHVPDHREFKPNLLEQQEDGDGIWLSWQQQQLATEYLPLWQCFDGFLHLLAPNFETVFDWRCQQEETTLCLKSGTLPDERKQWVARFIQHYERITRSMLQGRRTEGRCISLNERRSVVSG